MTSKERVRNYHDRQKQQGRKLATLYLGKEAKDCLRLLAGPETQGEITERAIAFYVKNDPNAQRKVQQGIGA